MRELLFYLKKAVLISRNVVLKFRFQLQKLFTPVFPSDEKVTLGSFRFEDEDEDEDEDKALCFHHNKIFKLFVFN